MDCSLPGSSVHWISQARKVEWVALLTDKRHQGTRGDSHAFPASWRSPRCGRRKLYPSLGWVRRKEPGLAGDRGGRWALGRLTGLVSWRCKDAPVLFCPSVPKMVTCLWKKDCFLIQEWLYGQRSLGFMRNKITFKSNFLRSGMGCVT